MFVKICGITNREDALAAVEAGADALGFNFYRQSPRYISPTGAAVITEKLPSHVKRVGIFVAERPEFIASVAIQAGLDIAQLYRGAKCRGIPFWNVLASNDATDLVFDAALLEGNPDAILLDSPSPTLLGGTGHTFPWRVAREASERMGKKIILAGGLDESNVEQAIDEARPWGVDVCSRIETTPGRKDHLKMKRFIEAAHRVAV